VTESAALQTAVFETLDGAITGNVVDEVSPDEPAPYTVIGEGTEQPNDTHTDDGSDETITLHVFDNATGSVRIKRIVAEIDTLLHHQTLELAAESVYDNGAIAYLTREFVEYLKEETEPGKYWRHAVLRYRVHIQGAES
jgi:hypothetical protein